MSNIKEWEKDWAKLLLEDAVIAHTASPEVGDIVDIEKYNYTNKKLNELTSFIFERGQLLIHQLLSLQRQEIVEKIKRNEICSNCGAEKESNLMSLCDKCLEEG